MQCVDSGPIGAEGLGERDENKDPDLLETIPLLPIVQECLVAAFYIIPHSLGKYSGFNFKKGLFIITSLRIELLTLTAT